MAHGFRSSWWLVTKSSWSESHLALGLQKRIWLKFFAITACHVNWWLWRSNFELTELGRKISTAVVWTAAKFACIRKLQGARAPVPHAWRRRCRRVFYGEFHWICRWRWSTARVCADTSTRSICRTSCLKRPGWHRMRWKRPPISCWRHKQPQVRSRRARPQSRTPAVTNHGLPRTRDPKATYTNTSSPYEGAREVWAVRAERVDRALMIIAWIEFNR